MPMPHLVATFEPPIRAKPARKAQCRLCSWRGEITRHHLIPLREARDQSWRNRAENLVPLCRRCHDLVEQKAKSGGDAWRRMLRTKLAAREIDFVLAHRTAEWLDSHYPPA